jgi:hypothetical protein
MAYTTDDLDTLDAAIKGSRLTVRIADRLTTYRSIDELIKARAHVAGILASQSAPTRSYPRFQQATFADE